MFKLVQVTAMTVVVLFSGSNDSVTPVVVADSNLNDVAVAVYQPTQSVIYVNPINMSRVGKDMETFFMAHEYAHIALHHVRGGDMRQKELDADCVAVRQVSKSVSLASVRFFSIIGDVALDSHHPTGSERANNILKCME